MTLHGPRSWPRKGFPDSIVYGTGRLDRSQECFAFYGTVAITPPADKQSLFPGKLLEFFHPPRIVTDVVGFDSIKGQGQ